jgi:hypothetical protein
MARSVSPTTLKFGKPLATKGLPWESRRAVYKAKRGPVSPTMLLWSPAMMPSIVTEDE